jgi:hypothetical protein
MINITVCSSTPTQELASATSALKKLYEERRNSVIREVVEFLKSHSDEAFTAREISESCGLSVPTIAGTLKNYSCIGTRDRITTRTFYALHDDGTPNINDKVTHQSKVTEYFYRERRGW